MEGPAGSAPAPRGWKPRVHLSTPRPRGCEGGHRTPDDAGQQPAALPLSYLALRLVRAYRHGVPTPDFRIESPADCHYPMAARKVEESNSHGCPCRWLSRPRVPMDGTFPVKCEARRPAGRASCPAVSPVRFERTTPAFGGQCSGSAELRRDGTRGQSRTDYWGFARPRVVRYTTRAEQTSRPGPEVCGDACGARTRGPRIDNPVLSH